MDFGLVALSVCDMIDLDNINKMGEKKYWMSPKAPNHIRRSERETTESNERVRLFFENNYRQERKKTVLYIIKLENLPKISSYERDLCWTVWRWAELKQRTHIKTSRALYLWNKNHIKTKKRETQYLRATRNIYTGRKCRASFGHTYISERVTENTMGLITRKKTFIPNTSFLFVWVSSITYHVLYVFFSIFSGQSLILCPSFFRHTIRMCTKRESLLLLC